jgi:G3E family GTPase
MRTVIVTGFLGSGKTTLLLQMMKHLTSRQQTFAVIINEVGDVGIDNQMLKQVGANVWEVLGGCICCTAVPGFERALDEAVIGYHPDYILVEPSGIARPEEINAIFDKRSKGQSETFKNIALIDGDRIDLLKKAVYPLLSSGIEVSGTVLITKTDVASPDKIKEAEDLVKEINPEADLINVTLTTDLEESLLEGLL